MNQSLPHLLRLLTSEFAMTFCGTVRSLLIIAYSHSTSWGAHSAKKLFPRANPKPPNVEKSEEQTTLEYGINIMNTRFWDPLSPDWKPEPFFNVLIQKYSCPFPCEYVFNQSSFHVT